jgi:hypothetical protein
VWCAAAVEEPPAPSAVCGEEGSGAKVTQPPSQAKAMEWGIFRVRAVLAAMAAHVASNNLL